MKAYLSSCVMFFRQIYSDSMLILIQITPIIAGLFFKFGLPFVLNFFNVTQIVEPYYQLIDILYSMLIPYMLCLSSALIILSEIDDSIASYLFVTPLGKKGYLFSRLILPAFVGFIINFAFIPLFSLSTLTVVQIAAVSLLASLNAVIGSLITVSAAGNRVEGMALAKLSSIILLGSIVPFFMKGNVGYVFMILPSFWISEYLIHSSFLSVFFGLFTAFLWYVVLYKTFAQKITR